MSERILLGPPPATLAILLDDPDACNLGQIVVLRRLIGAWQARAPSDT